MRLGEEPGRDIKANSRPHKRLEAWRSAVELTIEIYKLTRTYPLGEKFGLVSQMRRAAVSVASNIAEGAARNTKKEFIQFLFNAQGSLSELDTQLLISKKLNYCLAEDFEVLNNQIEKEGKLLSGLIRYLKA